MRRSRTYPLIGVFLGLGSPAGALALRWTMAGFATPSARWLAGEFASERLFYGYMTMGTVTAFALAGLWAGRAADRLAAISRTMRELSMRDALTGLVNRRYLDERFDEECARAVRTRRPLACIMADLDHFKALNDQHGHLVGDQVLRELATIFREIVRRQDIVGRFGGEEFLFILPETSGAQAAAVAEELRAAVSRDALVADGKLYPLTISLGVAERTPGMVRGAQLVDAADSAMYAAKAAGRNRVAVAPPEPGP